MFDDFNNLPLALSTPERPGRVTKVDPVKLPIEPMLTMSFRSSLPHPRISGYVGLANLRS
jgi:hypothetical protein